MKVLTQTFNNNVILFEVEYSDGIKRILIPRVIWEGFKEAISYGHFIGGKGEFVNDEDFSDDDFPSTENYLKKFHKAFKIDTKSQAVGNIQIWQPETIPFRKNLIFNNDETNSVISETIHEWFTKPIKV